MSTPWQSGDLCHYKERRHLVLLLAAQAMPGKNSPNTKQFLFSPKSWSALPLFYCLTLSFAGFRKMGKVSCVAAAQGCAWLLLAHCEQKFELNHWNNFVVESHLVLCWVACHHPESSFCLFMRHCSVSLWACCQLRALNPCPWPWLHIYSGMHADNVSYRVNTPPDFCLFAHIWKTDGMEKKKSTVWRCARQSVHFFCSFTTTAFPIFLFFFQRCFFISGMSTKGFLVTSDNPLLSQCHTGGMTQRCWVSL